VGVEFDGGVSASICLNYSSRGALKVHAVMNRDAIEVATFGFRKHESEDAQAAERPFFLNLTRSDPVTRDHINAVVAELVELAEQFGGDYDGWGCEVYKTPAA
jgi:regulator of RNase E activity RraB